LGETGCVIALPALVGCLLPVWLCEFAELGFESSSASDLGFAIVVLWTMSSGRCLLDDVLPGDVLPDDVFPDGRCFSGRTSIDGRAQLEGWRWLCLGSEEGGMVWRRDGNHGMVESDAKVMGRLRRCKAVEMPAKKKGARKGSVDCWCGAVGSWVFRLPGHACWSENLGGSGTWYFECGCWRCLYGCIGDRSTSVFCFHLRLSMFMVFSGVVAFG
jgi:hypothetical protein